MKKGFLSFQQVGKSCHFVFCECECCPSEIMAALVFNSVSVLQKLFSVFSTPILKSKYGLPQPPKCHVTITKDQIGDMPILIVGDIHGCLDELEDLIAKAKETTKSDKIFLVSVGDMVNKGPKSLEVLDLFNKLTAEGFAAAVRGNHEESVLRELRNLNSDSNYQLRSKYTYLKQFTDRDEEYLYNLPYSLSIPQINAVVVHAGLVPGVPLEKQNLIDLCFMRNISLQHNFWGTSVISFSDGDEGVGWATLWQGPQHVYFGHDARKGLQDLSFATGLDTGCVFGNSLTGVVISNNNQRQFISVKARKAYKGIL